MARVNIENIKPSEEAVKRNKDLEKQIQKAIDKIVPDTYDSKKYKGVAEDSDTIAQKIRTYFSESETSRKDIEERFLKDIRQYRGQYDPDVLSRIHPKRSKAFVRITRTKVKTVDSRLVDLLFPANGDSNWSIAPTTLPSIGPKQLNQIVQELSQSGQQPTRQVIELAVKNFAKAQSDKMSLEIKDQLMEMNYRDVMRQVIHSGNLYGTGILKGPMIMLTKDRSYKQLVEDGGETSWEMVSEDKLLPYVEAVNVWDFYPDMTATSIKDARFAIQRHKFTKRQLLDLAKRADFMSDKINKYISKTQEGDWVDKYHDSQLKSIGDISYWSDREKKSGRKYEVLEYWGYIDAKDLEEMDIEIPEKYKGDVEIAANLWVLGDYVIKAAVSHMGDMQWPFFLYYYDKDETNIFGEGIPSILRDIQELTNSAFRAMLDNAAISAGPQIEVNLDLLDENEDPTDVYPFKVWLRTGEGPDAQTEAVRIKKLPSYTSEFLSMCEAFGNYADEITTIPKYMWGEATPGIARTASGLSMLMGSANVTIKEQVKNFDDGITRPFISSMYHWNMKFNNNPDIKGDYSVNAEGVASLVAKEVYSQSLMQFAQLTNNPVDLPMVRRDSILRSIADALDLGDKNLVLNEQEIASNNQQQQIQAKQEREFMLRMTEIAREFGTSPNDMVENMRLAFADRQVAQQQIAQQQQQFQPQQMV